MNNDDQYLVAVFRFKDGNVHLNRITQRFPYANFDDVIDSLRDALPEVEFQTAINLLDADLDREKARARGLGDDI